MGYLSDINDYQVSINGNLWELVKSGDLTAKNEVRNIIDMLDIYFHNFIPAPGDVWVTLDDLIKRDIINMITLHKKVR